MKDIDVLKILQQTKTLITNSHIVYASGKHGDTFIDQDAIYPHITELSTLCREIAEIFSEDGIEVVVAPAIRGAILSQWVAYHLDDINCEAVPAVYAEESADQTSMIINHNYGELISGKKVLLVDSVLSADSSTRRLIKAVQAIGGKIIGLGTICNINNQKIRKVPKQISLAKINFESWEEKNCQLCLHHKRINKTVGAGHDFKKKK